MAGLRAGGRGTGWPTGSTPRRTRRGSRSGPRSAPPADPGWPGPRRSGAAARPRSGPGAVPDRGRARPAGTTTSNLTSASLYATGPATVLRCSTPPPSRSDQPPARARPVTRRPGQGVSLSDRYDHALAYARHLHRDQLRKGAGTPYISHLLSVSAMVLEMDGDENAAIAALLHDSVEDQEATLRGNRAAVRPRRARDRRAGNRLDRAAEGGLASRKIAYLRRPRREGRRRRSATAATSGSRWPTSSTTRARSGRHVERRRRPRLRPLPRRGRRPGAAARPDARPTTPTRSASSPASTSRAPGFRWYRSELTRVVTEIGGTGRPRCSSGSGQVMAPDSRSAASLASS